MKTHYSKNGEWGALKVNCGRFFTTDVKHTDNKNEVTCEHCKKSLKE